MSIHDSASLAVNQLVPEPIQPIALTELPKMLQDDGISAEALKVGWTPGRLYEQAGWRFPVFDMLTERPYRHPVTEEIAYRWKNADMTDLAILDYSWVEWQNGCPACYVLPGTRAAIACENGLCYLATDETDVLAYRSAGMLNVVSYLHDNWHNGVPEDLAQIAQQLGINEFRSLVDHDTTGEQSAHATWTALEDSRIIFNAYRLPAAVGNITSLWVRCQFDPVQFAAEVQRIQAYPKVIIQYPILPPRSRRKLSPDEQVALFINMSGIDWDAVYAEWVRDEVLKQCVPVISGEGNIERWVCPSPSHLEKAYFRISYDKDPIFGIPQCSCNIQDENYSWQEIGEWVDAIGFMEWLYDKLVKKQTQASNLIQEPTQINR